MTVESNNHLVQVGRTERAVHGVNDLSGLLCHAWQTDAGACECIDLNRFWVLAGTGYELDLEVHACHVWQGLKVVPSEVEKLNLQGRAKHISNNTADHLQNAGCNREGTRTCIWL